LSGDVSLFALQEISSCSVSSICTLALFCVFVSCYKIWRTIWQGSNSGSQKFLLEKPRCSLYSHNRWWWWWWWCVCSTLSPSGIAQFRDNRSENIFNTDILQFHG